MKKDSVNRLSEQTNKKIQPITEDRIMRMGGNNYNESADFRPKFMGNLKMRKKELEEAIQHLLEDEKQHKGMLSADDFIEELDRAEREISSQMHYKFRERKKSDLEKIELLMRRILKEEEFGMCEDCGERIPEGRLLVVPEATRCVPCQREEEKWESTKGLTGRTVNTFWNNTHSAWGDDGDSEDGAATVDLNLNVLSIMDLEETELEENPNYSD